jgi:hypothetical protein
MRLVAAKNNKTSFEKRPVAAPVRMTRTRSCLCGQQLDVCSRGHCPRCGRTLVR